MIETNTVDGITETFEAENVSEPQPEMIFLRFPSGMIVIEPSFVVDASGRPWWVDPRTRRCERVDNTIPQTDQG